MEYYWCKIQNHLLNYNPNTNAIDLVNLYQPYDIRTLIRLSKSESNIWIASCFINNKELSWALDKQTEGIILSENNTPNHGISLLNIEWAKNRDIQEFLSFFPDGCFLPFYGEYGMELVCYLPFIRYLHESNQLSYRKVETYFGMRPYYHFLNMDNFYERKEQRIYLKPIYRIPTPNLNEHGARKSEFECYKDYRSQNQLSAEKETVFIQNKFTVEWMKGPINYLPLIFLHYLFSTYAEKYNFIYSRPGLKTNETYSVDENTFCDYPDLSVVRQYGVTVFEEYCENKNYNQEKIELLSKTKKIISVQGGGSYIFPMYSNSDIFILHIEGDELKTGAYTADGFFSYLNNHNSNIHVSNTIEELWFTIKEKL